MEPKAKFKNRVGVPHHWTAEEDALLSQLSDAEIFRRLGVARITARKRRQKLGIPISSGKRGRPITNWTPEREALLGTDSDRKIAKRLGLHADRVGQRRRALGIPSFGASRRAASCILVDGNAIRARREALSLTRFALAGRNTALAAHLGTLETGEHKAVAPATFTRLCELLHCEPADIAAQREHL